VSKIRQVTLPRDEDGNDPNDHRRNDNYVERLKPVYSFVQTLGKKEIPTVFKFRSLAEIRKELSGPQYLIKPFLERDTLAVMFGESGCYKSFLATDIGLSLAYGVDFHSHRTYQGSVFYICGEGHGGIGRRIEAWLIHLAGMSGLELQAELTKRGIFFPIIFVSGQADLHISVMAIKGGAINFLEKPVKNKVLLESVREGFLHAGEIQIRNKLSYRYINMTNREREVMQHVVAGRSNNSIAKLLGVSERTVECHRPRVMKKMGAKSLPELVLIYYKCPINGSSPL
jgi:FixJ family two-component response regulator